MLFQLGYQVHIVSVLNIIEYEYAGELLNLGELKEKKDGFFARWNRLQVFKNYLKKHQFHCIIDNRTRNSWLRETIIAKWLYAAYKTIYVIRSYNLEYYFPKRDNLSKYQYQNAAAIVSVSKEIQSLVEKKYGFNNVTTIYNPIERYSIEESETPTINYKYILAYGRLDDAVKNYSLLLDAYSKSSLAKEKMKLIILGSGDDLELLKRKVASLQLLEDVMFLPFVKNPLPIVSKAKFVCLTSRFEGFPRVLIESLSVGVPVVSVNCKSGPEEIISNKQNGLLVENFDEKALAEAMDSFIFDKELYEKCKGKAKQSVERFSIEAISKDWKNLIERI
ncbi:glycosyltransferase family 4 protein [Oceanihabitans sediminis]|uniref:Glycosyltransferase family 4 protein n=2 Tax=Oceanihabitans sediminis TaxID=1812012 RepID=A0A368P5B7_9FLAO|nr:glycosyltransferase family 4 protein [Oceanihabitans sediminis]